MISLCFLSLNNNAFLTAKNMNQNTSSCLSLLPFTFLSLIYIYVSPSHKMGFIKSWPLFPGSPWIRRAFAFPPAPPRFLAHSIWRENGETGGVARRSAVEKARRKAQRRPPAPHVPPPKAFFHFSSFAMQDPTSAFQSPPV